jgi:hypothetical protein
MKSQHSFWQLPDLKHFFDPLYVGQVVATEVAEAHYSMSTFYFDYHDLFLIPKFLTVDRFGYLLSPVTLIKNVEIVLDAGSHCLCNSLALVHHGLADVGMSSLDALKWCLQRLCDLAARPVHIKITIFSNVEESNLRIYSRFEELIRLVLELIKQFRELGIRSTMSLCDKTGREWSIEDVVERSFDVGLQQAKMGLP